MPAASLDLSLPLSPAGDSNSQTGAANPWQGLLGFWREEETTLSIAAHLLPWLEYGTSQDRQRK